MNNNQATRELIKALTGKDTFVGTPKICISIFGGLVPAVLANQLIYWSDRGAKDWIWKSDKELFDETGVTSYQRKKYTKEFQDQGWLEIKLKKAGGAPTQHYRVDYEKFVNRIMKYFKMENEKFENGLSKNEQSLTDSTTENISKITKEKEPTPPAKKPAEKRAANKKKKSPKAKPKKDPRDIVSNQLCEAFENVFHVVRKGEDMDMGILWHKDNVKETMQRWRKPVKRMHILCRPKTIEEDPGWSTSSKETMEIIGEATERLMNADKVLTFDAPDQIERTFKSILADRKAAKNGVVRSVNGQPAPSNSGEYTGSERWRQRTPEQIAEDNRAFEAAERGTDQ